MLTKLARKAAARAGYHLRGGNPGGGFSLKPINADYRLPLYRSLYTANDLARRPFINIGSGSFFHPYWTNVDYVSDWYKGVQKDVVPYDIMAKEPLPFESSAIKIAYTSHCLEHVTDDAAASLFRQVLRVLEPGGLFRLTMPDAETDYRAYRAGDDDWFAWDRRYRRPGTFEHIYHRPADSVPLAERWLHRIAAQLCPNDRTPSDVKYEAGAIEQIVAERSMSDALDFFCSQCTFNGNYARNHISWWTQNKLEELLIQTGFSKVSRSGYHQSQSAVMRHSDLFDTTWPHGSLYVEAIK